LTARQTLRPAALRMSNDDWELTDVGRRNLEDLEGKWKRVCVLGGSRGTSLARYQRLLDQFYSVLNNLCSSGVGMEVVKELSSMGVNVVALASADGPQC
jgi:hypothetical protein